MASALLEEIELVARSLSPIARVETKDRTGKSAIHYAIESKKQQVIELLPDSQNYKGGFR